MLCELIMERSFLETASDSFRLGKFAACKSILESAPEDSWRESAMTRWLMDNNLVVCSFKEKQLEAGGVSDILDMVHRLQTTLKMMQGLPPSLKNLPSEMTVSFNVSALLLHRITSKEPDQTSSNQTHLDSTGVDQIMQIFSTSLKRVLSALGLLESGKADLKKLLSKMTGIAQFVPAGIVSRVSLYCCLLGLYHMTTKQYTQAQEILDTALKIQTSKTADGQRFISSQALIMDLQAGNFAVDLNRLQDESSIDVGSLARFLLAACCFQTNQWNASLDHIQTNQLTLPDSLNLTLKFIQGCCLYETGNFKSALEHLTLLTTSTDCDIKLKVKTLNLIGCCLATINKSYTAIQTFQEALKMDFSYLCPLYNISLVYRRLKLPEAEIEALTLIIQALRERNTASDCPSEPDDMIIGSLHSSSTEKHDSGYDIYEHSHSSLFVTYILAQRLWELGRYDKSAEEYRGLLQTIEDDVLLPECKAFRGLPSIPEIYLQSALSSYDAKDLEHTLQISNKIITKMDPRKTDKSRQDKLCSRIAKEDALPSTSYHRNLSGHQDAPVPSCSTLAPLSQTITSPYKDRKLSARLSQCLKSTSLRSYSGENGDVQGTDSRLLIATALLLKSNCLLKRGEYPNALNITNELLMYLSGVSRTDADEVGMSTKGAESDEQEEEESRRRKRRKVDLTLDSGDTTLHTNGQSTEQSIRRGLLEIKAKAYNNKAMILNKQMKTSEALHMLLLGTQCKPDDIDVLYNYALVLAKMKRKNEARETMQKLLVLETSLKNSPLSELLSQE